MTKITKFIRNKYDLLFLFLTLFFVLFEAMAPVNFIGAAVRPVLYAFLFIYLGFRKVRLKPWESFTVLLVNLILIKLFSGRTLFTINLFLMSFVFWSCITPMLSRFKHYLPAAMIFLAALSFLVPYYSIHMPLFTFLYLPFYILGFEWENIRIKRSCFSTAASIIGIAVHTAIIGFIFTKLLEKGNIKEFKYIYNFYNNKSIFVYSPIMVISFLVIVFSCMNLLLNRTRMKMLNKAANIDIRSMCFGFTMLTPILYVLGGSRLTVELKLIAALITAILFLLTYKLLCSGLRGGTDEPVRTNSRVYIPLTDIVVKWLFILSFVFVQVASVEFVIRGNNMKAFLECLRTPGFAYNLIFVLMLFGIITSIMGIKLGSVMMVILNSFLVLANFIKVKFFNEPFYLWDTFLIKDALIISKDYLSTRAIIILSVILLAMLVLLIKNFRRVMIFLKPRPNLLLLLVVIIAMRYNLYQLNIYGYAGINVCDTWEDSTQEFMDNGVYVENYLYLRDIEKYLNVKPVDYSREKVLDIVNSAMPGETVNALPSTADSKVTGNKAMKIENGIQQAVNAEASGGSRWAEKENITDGKESSEQMKASDDMQAIDGSTPSNENMAVMAGTQPNVVVILQESFWDSSNLPNVTFNKQIDSNLKKYQNATFVSPVFGGGTANVEFEVLTGFSTFFFNKGIIAYDVYMDHKIMALPQVFKNNGYSTTAIHPNTGEMYKRNKVYGYMGFDKFIDISGFNYEADKKGNFVSDDKFADKIIDTLNDSSDSRPKFIMGVSIQNHDSYDSSTKGYGNTEIKAQTDRLNDEEKDILNNYSQGIYDADKEIEKVIEAAGKSSKPTLVYIFGDHLPRLGYPLDNYDIYNKTGFLSQGSAADRTRALYETPVVRWASYKELPVLPSPISPNMLAYEILRDSGVSYPGYFNYLGVVGEKYPYLNNNLQDKNQLLQEDILKNYYMLQYDLMFGKAYAAEN